MSHAAPLIIAMFALSPYVCSAPFQDERTPTPAARKIAAAKADFEAARLEASKALGRATSDAEHEAIVAKTPQRFSLCPDFWSIAAAHPDDPGSAEGLAWIVRYATQPDEKLRAADVLLRDFATSEFWSEACAAFSFLAPTSHAERILRDLIERSPHASVRGTATFQLSWVIPALDRSNPELAREEIRLLELVRTKFPEVPHWRSGTLGEAAERRLFEIRHLTVGATAPEIEGIDVAGVSFKLSDYRGKVVLLDFWGHW